MPDQDRTDESNPGLFQQTPRIVLRIGERLSINAYSGSGELLLSAGQVIQDAWQLSRLLHPDTQFGDEFGVMMWKVHLVGGRTPVAVPAFFPGSVSASTPASTPAAVPVSDAKSPEDEAEQEAEALTQMPQVFRRAYTIKSDSVKQIKTVFSRIEDTGTLDIPEAEQTVGTLMDQVTSDRLALASMTQLKDSDAYTYCHSVNVCILSVYLVLTTNYEQDIKSIGLGALLHDIGKLTIPASVLQKRGPLDEHERSIVQEHPRQGLMLLQNAGCTDTIVQSCVLDHHEKATGRGYPRRKSACEISPYAKIISLADVYDALTTDRPYRRAMSARDALLLMVRDMGHDFDPWLLKRFVEVVGNIADRTYITPDGYVALKQDSSETSVRQIIQAEGYVEGLDAVA